VCTTKCGTIYLYYCITKTKLKLIKVEYFFNVVIECVNILQNKNTKLHVNKSIHPSFHGLLPVGVHCVDDCPSPVITILCLPAESMNVFLAPLLDVVQLFSVGSASSRCSFHYAKYDVFHQSGVYHSTDMTKQGQFFFQDDAYDVLHSSYS